VFTCAVDWFMSCCPSLVGWTRTPKCRSARGTAFFTLRTTMSLNLPAGTHQRRLMRLPRTPRKIGKWAQCAVDVDRRKIFRIQSCRKTEKARHGLFQHASNATYGASPCFVNPSLAGSIHVRPILGRVTWPPAYAVLFGEAPWSAMLVEHLFSFIHTSPAEATRSVRQRTMPDINFCGSA